VRAPTGDGVHLDKCIGATLQHLCKNIWTDRRGAETCGGTNVETKPGIGYPKGKWERTRDVQGRLGRRRRTPPASALGKGPDPSQPCSCQPNMPKRRITTSRSTSTTATSMGPGRTDQPVAEAFSPKSGRKIETIQGGPNWTTISPASQLYAAKDVNLEEKDRRGVRRMFMHYCRGSATIA